MKFCNQIIIDYYMAFFISHVISTRDSHISPRAEGSPVAKKRSVRASLSAGEIEFLINVSLHLISGVTISSNSLKEAMSILRKFFNPFGSSADNSWIRE